MGSLWPCRTECTFSATASSVHRQRALPRKLDGKINKKTLAFDNAAAIIRGVRIETTAVARPACPILLGWEHVVQVTAGGGLAIIHDALRRPRSRHDEVHLVRAGVDGVQRSAFPPGDLAEGVPRDLPARLGRSF